MKTLMAWKRSIEPRCWSDISRYLVCLFIKTIQERLSRVRGLERCNFVWKRTLPRLTSPTRMRLSTDHHILRMPLKDPSATGPRAAAPLGPNLGAQSGFKMLSFQQICWRENIGVRGWGTMSFEIHTVFSTGHFQLSSPFWPAREKRNGVIYL